MTTPAPHPFPPVVRWAVFPALASLAGAAGGALAAAAASRRDLPFLVGIAGGMSAGGAFGAMLSRRAWLSLLAGPVLAVLITCAAVAVVKSFERGAPEPALDVLRQLLARPGDLFIIGFGVWIPAAACHAAFRLGSSPSWRALFGIYAVAAILAALPPLALLHDRQNTRVSLLFFASVALQALAFRASLAVAWRPQK